MKKLTFFYATMNNGKSLKLMIDNYNYTNAGYSTIALKPSLDTRDDKITTRIAPNLAIDCIQYNKTDDIKKLVTDKNIDIIFIDEVQFSTKKQINQLRELANDGITIFAYGLRTNFKCELFEGSQQLMAVSDKIIELPGLCHCGKKTLVNARIIDNKIIKEGEEILCGAEELYLGLCHHCWSNNILPKNNS